MQPPSQSVEPTHKKLRFSRSAHLQRLCVNKKEVTVIRTATCCCWQASIGVEGEPKIHLVCHCNNCKKRTGSAFGISAYFADDPLPEPTLTASNERKCAWVELPKLEIIGPAG